MGIGWQEVLIVLFIMFLLFGTRIPKIARSLGESIVEFKKGIGQGQQEADLPEADPRQTPSNPTPSDRRNS